MTDRIRREPSSAFGGGDLGYVGTYKPWVFQIYYSDHKDWALMTQFPDLSDHIHRGNSEDLKPEAERLLREYLSYLGAVIPEVGDRF